MQDSLRALPALQQINLALKHRGFTVLSPDTHKDTLKVALPGCLLELHYLDEAESGNNQLLELLMPLNLLPDDQQLQTLAPVLAIFNSALGGMSLVSGPDGLLLRSSVLHPRQIPDLKYLVELVHRFIWAWTYSYSKLSPYVLGYVPFERVLIGSTP